MQADRCFDERGIHANRHDRERCARPSDTCSTAPEWTSTATMLPIDTLFSLDLRTDAHPFSARIVGAGGKRCRRFAWGGIGGESFRS